MWVVAPPGLEAVLCAEAVGRGFAGARVTEGGVTCHGGWPEVWRANLEMRGATRVLARIGSFMAFHLAQLDKRARKFDWAAVLRPDVPVRVDCTTIKSKIYHAGAATQRIETALRDSHGLTIAADAPVVVKVRIDDNRVTISVDTSGDSLHKRGHKQGVGKAPMRETLAALFLRQCGYQPGEALVDPMCGSGTFVIEAAEITARLQAGRSRDFAFQHLASYDGAAFDSLKITPQPPEEAVLCHGSDRDQGVIGMAQDNAARAGIARLTRFTCHGAAQTERPSGPPGLVLCNPPYGGRIGNKNLLYPLYGTLGETLRSRFRGWRVGIVTSEPGLAKATGLPFLPQGPVVPHGGLKIRLYRTDPLP